MRKNRTGGFTLVEMMIALVVLAVLLAITALELSDLIRNDPSSLDLNHSAILPHNRSSGPGQRIHLVGDSFF